jgi:hypothetical protein
MCQLVFIIRVFSLIGNENCIQSSILGTPKTLITVYTTECLYYVRRADDKIQNQAYIGVNVYICSEVFDFFSFLVILVDDKSVCWV